MTKKLVSATLTGVAIFIFLLRAVFPSARNRQGDTSKMGNPITEWIRSTMEDQDTNRAKNAQNVALWVYLSGNCDEHGYSLQSALLAYIGYWHSPLTFHFVFNYSNAINSVSLTDSRSMPNRADKHWQIQKYGFGNPNMRYYNAHSAFKDKAAGRANSFEAHDFYATQAKDKREALMKEISEESWVICSRRSYYFWEDKMCNKRKRLRSIALHLYSHTFLEFFDLFKRFSCVL